MQPQRFTNYPTQPLLKLFNNANVLTLLWSKTVSILVISSTTHLKSILIGEHVVGRIFLGTSHTKSPAEKHQFLPLPKYPYSDSKTLKLDQSRRLRTFQFLVPLSTHLNSLEQPTVQIGYPPRKINSAGTAQDYMYLWFTKRLSHAYRSPFISQELVNNLVPHHPMHWLF